MEIISLDKFKETTPPFDIGLDTQHHHLVMYSSTGELLGAMRYLPVKKNEGHARVINAVTRESGKGLGKLMYFALLASFNEMSLTLSPDPNSVKGYASLIWKHLWSSPSILKSPLPWEAQRDNYNVGDADLLTVSNPNIPLRLMKKIIKQDPQHIRELVLTKQLQPHPYNYAYSLSCEHPLGTSLLNIIEHRRVSFEEIYAHDQLWERRYLAFREPYKKQFR
ncbi:hypothetical protein [Alteromonas sp. 14N.309.X.WAT.G.H12]|uniref:hypothetical protein n=1 Tax=Alteromonas sp. 14N.309.X.WAT.G.H12 TaxID=3120824 RepID=UPI002FD5525D